MVDARIGMSLYGKKYPLSQADIEFQRCHCSFFSIVERAVYFQVNVCRTFKRFYGHAAIYVQKPEKIGQSLEKALCPESFGCSEVQILAKTIQQVQLIKTRSAFEHQPVSEFPVEID